MSSLELGFWSFPVLLAMIFLRVPIGLAMLLVGFFGTWLVTGSWVPILAKLKSLTYDTFSSYSLSIVPLFLLMGQFAMREIGHAHVCTPVTNAHLVCRTM